MIGEMENHRGFEVITNSAKVAPNPIDISDVLFHNRELSLWKRQVIHKITSIFCPEGDPQL
jgi:hypothetical protein